MSNLRLRLAENSDLDMYYEWANDPVVRTNSFSTALIPYEDHVKWFNKAMQREDVVLLVMMDDDKAIGQIRINVFDSVAEISYSIASEFRGKGFGSKIVSLLIDKIKAEYHDIKTIRARVKPENSASLKIFENKGFINKEVVFELNVDD